MAGDRLVARGQEALATGRWEEARAAFEASLAQEKTPEALLGLAGALWWLADVAACVDVMEQAYAELRRVGDDADACITAVWLAVMYKKSLGNQAACGGWLSRAARLLDDREEPRLQGWLWLGRAHETESTSAARHALAAAREAGDADLELCAVAQLGVTLVAAGDVEQGMALVDEAMAGALGGEFTSPDTVAAAACSMLEACELAADVHRVTEWCRVADRFMRTYGGPFLFADCRMHYGGVLLVSGEWEQAEQELRSAVRAAPPESDYHVQAVVRLSNLRLRQGRLEEAEALIADLMDRPAARPLVAALRLARGDHQAAADMLSRHLEVAPPGQPQLARALVLLVKANLAAGDEAAAAAAAQRLRDDATAPHRSEIHGHADYAAGLIAASDGRDEQAAGLFQQALDGFIRCHLPYEAACARLALAEALSTAHPSVAVEEAQAAFGVFERLGAARDADATAACMRALGAPRTGRKRRLALTEREEEVLRLLGAGLSNPEIAERLFISRKTAAHHVSNVLAKLGLRNRAEAAAHAAAEATRTGSHEMVDP